VTDNIKEIIIAETSNRLDTEFLNHLSRGTTGYRSLHNLTHEVGDQYRGRFLVELLQNAHDALPDNPKSDIPARVEMILEAEAEEEFGVLYIANDGNPFSKSNFLSLSQLAQSDKDPETNIGNKGIGFRSVLEISARPQIFSRSSASSRVFDGYCFGFKPEFITDLLEPILLLAAGKDNVRSPIDPEKAFVDWDQSHLKKFRSRLADRDRFLIDLRKLPRETLDTLSIELLRRSWLQHELKYLSPYLFPLPLNPLEISDRLLDFQERNFASVIRLPLKNSYARKAVIEKMGEFSATTVMFLERLKELYLFNGSDPKRTISRRERIKTSQPLDTTFISINDSLEDQQRRYVMWQECILTSNDPVIAEAILKELPELWHSLQEIKVSVATPTSMLPEQGFYSVYLPTLQATGCGAYVNAPFYAKLDRTGIDFTNSYNEALAKRAVNLAVRVAHGFLTEGKAIASRAAVDLMAPWPGKEGEKWFARITQVTENWENKIVDLVFLATDQGWRSPNCSSIIPVNENLSVITTDILRKHATFDAIDYKLDGRRNQIIELYRLLKIPAEPLPEDLAKTLGKVAKTFFNDLREATDWNSFLRDIMKLMPEVLEHLKNEEIFLGTDEKLHSSKGCTIFFRKVRGIDEDNDHQGDVGKYPLLQKHVAFLNSAIDFSGADDPLYHYLNGRFVQVFRVENVLEKVLCRITPQNPVANNHKDSHLCGEILRFAIELVKPLHDLGRAQSSIQHLKKIRVPCNSGWFRMAAASFGPGWSGTLGQELSDYFNSVDTPQCKAQRQLLLIPPTDTVWGTTDEGGLRRLFSDAGMMNGIRLVPLTPEKCGGNFGSCKGNLSLPPEPPEMYSSSVWGAFRTQSTKYKDSNELISSWKTYQLKGVCGIPGLDEYEQFNERTRELFLSLILNSLPHWSAVWQQCKVSRSDDVRSFDIQSPLFCALSTIQWLPVHKKEKDKEQRWQRANQGWLISSSLLAASNAWHYTHLTPFRKSVAAQIEKDSTLKSVLCMMGVPTYEPDGIMTDSRFLERIARTVSDDTHDLPVSILVGQVREAWKLFKPNDYHSFPDSLIYRTGTNSKLMAIKPLTDFPLYLPDSSAMKVALEMNELPIIEIKTREAQKLRSQFNSKYGEKIRLASKLVLTPLVGNEVWSGNGDELLADSDLEWLPPVLLTLVAHCGDQEQGVKSQTFIDRLETLQLARISWVSDLSMKLSYSDDSISGNHPLHAFWIEKGKDKVLILSEECRRQFFLASEALAKLLDREDLRFPLRLLLKELDGLQPGPEHILEALAHIEIDGDNYREVLDQWTSGQGLGQLIHLLQPFVMALDSSEKIDQFNSLTSIEHIREFLESCDLSGISGQMLLDLAHQHPNPRELGVALFKISGDDRFQLTNINSNRKILRLSSLENRDAAAEYRTHINDAHLPLHALLATIASRKATLGKFISLTTELSEMKCPADFGSLYWSVELHHVLSTLAVKFREWGASDEELSAFSKENVDQFTSALLGVGITIDEDPQTKAQKNRSLFKSVQSRLEQTALAWLLKQKTDPGSWRTRFESLKGAMDTEMEKNGFLIIWKSERIFTLMKNALSQNQTVDELTSVMISSDTLDEFEKQLCLTPEELSNAQKKLEELKEQDKKRCRQIEVCGHPFDAGEDNLSNLMEHIREIITDENLDVSLFSLESHVVLNKAKESGKTDGKQGGVRIGKARGGKESADDKLVGLTGEIHVFRMMQKKYGQKAIHSGVWKSKNSQKVFDDNPSDDDLGYDFCFKLKGKTHHIEVKASRGNDSSFRLGTSEVRIARKLANKKIKSDIFQIIHVHNALSTTPSFHVLPNPFEDRYRDKFELSDAEVWVRYRKQRGA
jgi:hypothetical protein